MSNKKGIRILIFGLLMIVGAIIGALVGHQTVANAQTKETADAPLPNAKFKPGPTRVVEIDEPEWGESVRSKPLSDRARLL